MAEPTPDSTAVRTALWRALHVELDPPPHVLDDLVGLALAAPDEGWRERPDMSSPWTRGLRAAMVARSRFVEDLVAEHRAHQYVLLGAGLDSFAQRRPDVATRVFEVDQPGPQEWKRRRLVELGYAIPELVPVDFEAGERWLDRLVAAGFDASQPAVVSSTGVAMYLSRAAIEAMLRQIATLAPGSTLAMTFIVPDELMEPDDRRMFEWARKGAEAAGTPFATQFAPSELLALARSAGFKTAEHVASTTLADRYFVGRADGLRPSTGEDFLVATT